MRALYYVTIFIAGILLIVSIALDLTWWLAPEIYAKLIAERREAYKAALSKYVDKASTANDSMDEARQGGEGDELLSLMRTDDKAEIVALVFKGSIPERSYGEVKGAEFIDPLRFCNLSEPVCKFDPMPEGRSYFGRDKPIGKTFKFAVNAVRRMNDQAETELLFDRNSIIQWAGPSSQTNQPGVFVAYSDEDTDRDGLLTYLDKRKLLLTRSAKIINFEIPGSLVSVGPGTAPSDTLPVTYMIDVNGDGRFDFDLDTERLGLLDLNTGVMTPTVSEDVLAAAQAIVDLQ